MNPELDALVWSLANAAQKTPGEVLQATKDHIGRVSETMRQTVRVDTGATRDSISDEVRIERGRIVGESGPMTSYAKYLEEGTATRSPHPFAGPAMDKQAPEYVDDVGEAATRWL